MSRIALLFFLSLSCKWITAQKSGIVIFNHTNYIEFENMPADMPKSFTSVMELSYNATESVYKRDVTVVEPESDQNRRGFRMMRNRNNNITYKRMAEDIVMEKIDFLGKEFLIKDTIENFPWKISAGEQKIICGKMCMKATYQDSTSKYVVFFTPQIPVSTGPDKYGNLPGLILEYQSAKTHIIATAIKPSEAPIVFESKEKEMTRAEFNKIRDEKMEEQRQMWGSRPGSGGNMRVIRN